MIVHQLLCWFSQEHILVGSHILVSLHAIWLFVSLGSLVISSIVGLHGQFL